MSFGESIFYAGFIQKITKEDLNIKRARGIILPRIHGKVIEDTRGLHTEGGDQTLLGGVGRPTPVLLGLLWWEATTSL
jgi:hypothetical protein